MAHGKSASQTFPIGARSMAFGKVLAPKSLRASGRYLSDHSTENVSKALGFDLSALDINNPADKEFLRIANHL